MGASTQLVGDPEPAGALLHKLAAALGCSVESFARPSSSEPDQTTELLRLWMDIHREEDRAEVLAIVKGFGAAGRSRHAKVSGVP